jgi:hypothetical protein
MCYSELASKEKLIVERGLLVSKKNPVRPTHSHRARSLVDRALSTAMPPKQQRQVGHEGDIEFPGIEEQGMTTDDKTFEEQGMTTDDKTFEEQGMTTDDKTLEEQGSAVEFSRLTHDEANEEQETNSEQDTYDDHHAFFEFLEYC